MSPPQSNAKRNAYLHGMTTFLFIETSAAVILILFFLMIFLRHRKNSDLYHRYCEAMQVENDGDEERAIQLYRDALNRSHRRKAGDKRLIGDMEQRLKTLLISADFEKSFQRKGMLL